MPNQSAGWPTASQPTMNQWMHMHQNPAAAAQMGQTGWTGGNPAVPYQMMNQAQTSMMVQFPAAPMGWDANQWQHQHQQWAMPPNS